MKSSDLQRAPGRPKVIQGDVSVVSTRVASDVLDAIIHAASQRTDGSVAGVVRDVLTRTFRTDK